MRALVLSDLHAEEEALDKVKARLESHNYGAVILLGDITNRGPISFAEDLLDAVGKNGAKCFAVFGNMDPAKVAGLLEERNVSIHAKKVGLFGKWSIAGFGGGAPSVFDTPSEFLEEEIYGGLKVLGIDGNTILATHAPPMGAGGFDITQGGDSIGSSSIRRIVDETKPAIALCGHVHEREGIAMVGKTKVVKVGAAMNGRAAELGIGVKISVKIISL